MTENEIESVVHHFCEAAKRSLRAGFQVVEIHMAHGYLLHEFLSPLSNQRTDQYGGSFENRIRLPLRIAQEVRQLWPSKWPVLVRVSSTDWTEGGWDLHQTVEFCCALKEVGVDAIDCSSGGLTATAKIPVQPGYQVPFSEAIRKETGLPTLAVGMITEAPQAEQIVALGQADFVLLARELLRDPYWPLHAAHTLGVDIAWPSQYERAKPRPK